MFKYLVLVFCLVQLVFSDEIYIYGPPTNGIYHPKDVMDIRYKVRSLGMTRIWSTSAKLTHVDSNKTIDTFPLVQWSATNSNSSNPMVHQSWDIPANIPNGNYSLAIGGNTSYLCSEKGNGSAPFKHCESVITKYTYFFISNGTVEDSQVVVKQQQQQSHYQS